MDWKGKNVLVTGSDGFIGGALAKALLKKGANVFALIRDLKIPNVLKESNPEGNIKYLQGDIRDADFVTSTLKDNSIDTIFHLAAQTLVNIANKSPVPTFESNIKGTWTILEAARNTKTVRRIVVASSDKAYGDQKTLPYTENQSLLGIYPYDASKVCTDVLSRSYAATYSLPVAVTRCANIYGGGDLNMSRIVPGTIVAILKGETPVIRSDGTLERDYMFIDDAINAYLTLAENLDRKEIQGQAFNFGTETPISVIDFFNKIIQACGSDVKPKILGENHGEIKRQFLGIEKAKKLLNWTPQVSLEDGLKRSVEWYKAHQQFSK